MATLTGLLDSLEAGSPEKPCAAPVARGVVAIMLVTPRRARYARLR